MRSNMSDFPPADALEALARRLYPVMRLLLPQEKTTSTSRASVATEAISQAMIVTLHNNLPQAMIRASRNRLAVC